MTQALYAHMNNKIKKKEFLVLGMEFNAATFFFCKELFTDFLQQK
jgi:hypothetical protein